MEESPEGVRDARYCNGTLSSLEVVNMANAHRLCNYFYPQEVECPASSVGDAILNHYSAYRTFLRRFSFSVDFALPVPG
jgi:hypothetical protein